MNIAIISLNSRTFLTIVDRGLAGGVLMRSLEGHRFGAWTMGSGQLICMNLCEYCVYKRVCVDKIEWVPQWTATSGSSSFVDKTQNCQQFSKYSVQFGPQIMLELCQLGFCYIQNILNFALFSEKCASFFGLKPSASWFLDSICFCVLMQASKNSVMSS